MTPRPDEAVQRLAGLLAIVADSRSVIRTSDDPLGHTARASHDYTQGCPAGAPCALGAPGMFISRSL